MMKDIGVIIKLKKDLKLKNNMNKQAILQNAGIFQQDVYRFAADLALKKSVLDIGCSYPKKLEKFILPVTKDITGIDLPEIIDWIKEDVQWGQWIACDIEKESLDLDKKFDLIICADVVEHLDNPNVLMEMIKKHSNEKTLIVISTPDGNTTLKQNNGKPANIQHKQEWGRDEFKAYLQSSGLDILESRYVIEQQIKPVYICNYFLCKKSELKKKSILITIPNMHWIHKHVVHKLLLLQKDGRYKLNIIMPSHKPYENNLHHIVNDFMAGDYDFWLNIDADNPPMNNPLDLVELDKDIIGLPTPIYHYTGKKGERPIYENVYKYIEKDDAYAEWQIKEGLQKVDAIGTGCFLIARRVFEHPEMRKAPFERKLNEDGTVNKGNDISFCERIKEKTDFEIYAHFDYRCDHFCENSLIETTNAFKNLYE